MVLKRTFERLTAVVLKRTNWRLGKCSTVVAVWRWLTAEEAEAELLAADVLVLSRWGFEKRWLVLVCPQVKMVAVCQSVDSSLQT